MMEGEVVAEVIAGKPAAFDQVVPAIVFTDLSYSFVDLELQSTGTQSDPNTGTVAGCVTNTDSLPLQGATVAILASGYSTLTGVDGCYVLDGVPAGGPYDIVSGYPNDAEYTYEDTAQSVTVPPGDAVVADFVLPPTKNKTRPDLALVSADIVHAVTGAMPTGLELARATLTVENVGAASWTPRDIAVHIEFWDLPDKGPADSLWLQSSGDYVVRQTEVQLFSAAELAELGPKGTANSTMELELLFEVSNLPDFVDAVMVRMEAPKGLLFWKGTTLDANPLNDSLQIEPFEVGLGVQTLFNCVGAILGTASAGAVSGSSLEVAYNLAKTSMAMPGIADEIGEASVLINSPNWDDKNKGLDKLVDATVKLVLWHADIAGELATAGPVLHWVDVAMNELTFAGCGALVGTGLVKLLGDKIVSAVAVAVSATTIGSDAWVIGGGSPVELRVVDAWDHQASASVDGGGVSSLPGATAVVLGESKYILGADDGHSLLVEIEGLDTGTYELFAYRRNDDGQLVRTELAATPIEAGAVHFGVVDSYTGQMELFDETAIPIPVSTDHVPPAPAGVAVQVIEGTIDLTWSPVDTASHYVVSVALAGESPAASIKVDGTATSIDGLLVDQAVYSFSVQAVDAAGMYSNPSSSVSLDSDGNSLPDWWEAEQGIANADGDADGDNDGLTNEEEFYSGTDPLDSDSDGDGLPDGYEQGSDTDPTVDDSDQVVDDQGTSAADAYQCSEGSIESIDCYTGPQEFAGTGACAQGSQPCVNGELGACSGSVLPKPESCDGVDNNCDGTTDEAFGVGQPCTEGSSGCELSGFTECAADGAGTICSVEPGDYPFETCDDGVDNDCDGLTDYEDSTDCVGDCAPGSEESCGTDAGECTIGTRICSPEATWSDCSGLIPASETCDDLDNDCDGLTDEDSPDLGASCSNGTGECRRPGSFVCSDGGLACDAVPAEPAASEVCADQLDNDCNGMTDDLCGCASDENCDVGLVCDPELGLCVASGIAALCESCASTLECEAEGAICVDLTEDQRICTEPCDDDAPCPPGYGCSLVVPHGAPAERHCLPSSSDCNNIVIPVETEPDVTTESDDTSTTVDPGADAGPATQAQSSEADGGGCEASRGAAPADGLIWLLLLVALTTLRRRNAATRDFG